MNKKHELTDIVLFEEDGDYYLKLKYVLTDDHKVEELEIPKVKIPFNKNVYPSVSCSGVYSSRYGYGECYLDTGYGSGKMLPICKGETAEANHVFYTIKTIKEIPEKLTVSEIEKRLGYPIEIVGERKKK